MLDKKSETLLIEASKNGEYFSRAWGDDFCESHEKFTELTYFLEEENYITKCATQPISYKICPKTYAYIENLRKLEKEKRVERIWALVLAVIGGLVAGILLYFLGMN